MWLPVKTDSGSQRFIGQGLGLPSTGRSSRSHQQWNARDSYISNMCYFARYLKATAFFKTSL